METSASKQRPRDKFGFALSVVGWFTVFFFWLFATRSFHPTLVLAVIVTTALIGAYACASYLQHLYLIPRYREHNKRQAYYVAMTGTMLGLTALALLIIRICYLYLFGPYPVNYLVVDYALDLFGMLVHVTLAMWVVHVYQRIIGHR
ncbi:MAG: hypothetical protein U0Y68_20260 [Blastocatellia bacterium]